MEVPPREGGFDGIAWINKVLGSSQDGKLLQKVEEAIEVVENEVLAEEARCHSTVVALEAELDAYLQSGAISKILKEADVAKATAAAALGPCTDAQANPEIASLARIDAALHSLDNATRVLQNIRDWDAQVRDSERAIQFISTTLENVLLSQNVSDSLTPFTEYIGTLQKLTKTLGGLKNALAAIETLPGYTYRHNTVMKLISKVTPLMHKGAVMTVLLHLRTWDYQMLSDSVKHHISLENTVSGSSGVADLSKILFSALIYQIISHLWEICDDHVEDFRRDGILSIPKLEDLRIPATAWSAPPSLSDSFKANTPYETLVADSLDVLTPTLDSIGNEIGKHFCHELQTSGGDRFAESEGRLLISLMIAIKLRYVRTFLQAAFIAAAQIYVSQSSDDEAWESLVEVRGKLMKLESSLVECLNHHSSVSNILPQSLPIDECTPNIVATELPWLVFEPEPHANYKPLDTLMTKRACVKLRSNLIDTIDISREKISQCLADRTSYNPGLACVSYVEKQYEKLVAAIKNETNSIKAITSVYTLPMMIPAVIGTVLTVYIEIIQRTQAHFFTQFKAQIEAQRSNIGGVQTTGLLQSTLEALFLVLNIRYMYGSEILNDIMNNPAELASSLSSEAPINGTELITLVPTSLLPLGAKIPGVEMRGRLELIISALHCVAKGNTPSLERKFADILMPSIGPFLREARELVIAVSTHDIQVEFTKLGPIWASLQDPRLDRGWVSALKALLEKESNPSDSIATIASNPDFSALSCEPSSPVKSFSTKCVNLLGTLFSFPEQASADLRLRKSWDIENVVLPGILYNCIRYFIGELEKVQIHTIILAFRVAIDVAFITTNVKSLGSHILFRQDDATPTNDDEWVEVANNLTMAVCELRAILEALCTRVITVVPDLSNVLKVPDLFEDPDFEKLMARSDVTGTRSVWASRLSTEKQDSF